MSAYDARRHAPLPWGHWLRRMANGAFEDRDGRQYRSVRDAYWVGRLGFPDEGGEPFWTHHSWDRGDLLLQVLEARAARALFRLEETHDVFKGDPVFAAFYSSWLLSVGLVASGPLERGRQLAHDLTAEGGAVLAMLIATREPPGVEMPPAGGDTTGRGARADGWRATFERRSSLLRHRFAREDVGRLHLITLTSASTASRMPTLRIVWSQAFTSEVVRDRVFGWLADRVDRWDAWGDIAYGRGGAALNQHLLAAFAGWAFEDTGPDGSEPGASADFPRLPRPS